MQTYPHGTFVVVLDCADLERSATFWCEVLGYQRPHPSTNRYLSLVASQPRGMELLLQRVPEPNAKKNRVHLDLRTRDLDTEVHRVVDAGARLLTTQPYDENSWRWHILADPDGNEFCILQPPDDFPWPDY